MKANRWTRLRRLRELTLPRADRTAARAERRAEEQLRRERDSEHTAERRRARVEAEAWRDRSGYGTGP